MGMFSAPEGQTPAPEMPKPPQAPNQPQGAKPKRRSMQTTFLGESASPAGFEGKSLIGQ